MIVGKSSRLGHDPSIGEATKPAWSPHYTVTEVLWHWCTPGLEDNEVHRSTEEMNGEVRQALRSTGEYRPKWGWGNEGGRSAG